MMRFRLVLGGVVLVALGCSSQSSRGPVAHSHGSPSAAMANADLGDFHHPVSTSNALAQKQFDRGLALIYAFNHNEAVNAFNAALKADPNLAMGHWGIALALGPNYNDAGDADRQKQAFAEIHKAMELLSHASPVEKDYIQALAKRFSDDPKADGRKLAVEYSNAMRELMHKYPDDLDAATLFADSMMVQHPWHLWLKDGRPEEGTSELVAVLEGVMKRNPDHIGANHLYIHAVEASPHPEYALEAAARLPANAAGAGHLVHMPSHVYARVGDWEAAASSNDLAVQVDRSYIKANSPQGIYPMMYYSHNMHFLAWANSMQGNYKESIKAARELTAHVSQHLAHMPMLEGFMPTPLMIEVRFHKWNEILATPAPEAKFHVLTAMHHYARGSALAATGKVDEAKKERAAFEMERKGIPSDAGYSPQNNAATVFAIAGHMLDARIAMAQKDTRAAIHHLRDAVAAEDSLNYMEPPDWYGPTRESLGAALLSGNEPDKAEKVFREDLEKNPRNPRSLFGLIESLKAQQNSAAAELLEPQLKEGWKNADTALRVEDL